jgi:hypothetical protein
MRRKGKASVPEYYVSLEVVQRILSDPQWSKKAEKVTCKSDFRKLLLEFCRLNGEIIKLNEKTILLYVKPRF